MNGEEASKVLELSSQGRSQPEIARILQISQLTVNRDIAYLRKKAKENVKEYINDIGRNVAN